MASKKKKISRSSMSNGPTTAKQAARNRMAAKNYKGATRTKAGTSIAVNNKRAGRRPNPKAVNKAIMGMTKKSPSFVRSGSRAPGVKSRNSTASKVKNLQARTGREIMRHNQALVKKDGKLRSKSGQRRTEGKQAQHVSKIRANLATASKAFANAKAKGDKLGMQNAKAAHRAHLSEYKGWRKGGSKVNAGG